MTDDDYAASWRAAMTMVKDYLEAIDEGKAALALCSSGLAEPLPPVIGEPLSMPVYAVHGVWAVTG